MPRLLPLSIFALVPFFAATAAPEESDYYRVAQIPAPEGEVPEISGIEILPDKKIAVATRRGDIFVIEGAYEDDPSNATWTLFAQGLHEPLGLAWKDGSLYATQRPEVTRLEDTDGDGRADVIESINSDWGVNGNYHEYTFGSRHDPEGNIWVVLCLTGSFNADSDYRGWCLRVTPEGEMIPTVSGIRSPGGIGTDAQGRHYYTDNQGIWNGSSSLKHLAPGKFVGVPQGNKFYDLPGNPLGERPADPEDGGRLEEQRRRIPELVPPAVILPHGKMGQSPAGIECDETGGKFGPFANQLFVGEQTYSEVQRVFLEEVNGVMQGACFKFRQGFGSGNITVRFAPDGTLFTGGTNRGWGARGGKVFALERVRWTGETPFEVKEMKAAPDGFELVFTQPVDAGTAADPKSYEIGTYTYIYQSKYGSPEVDQSTPQIRGLKVSDDGMSVHLTLDGLVQGHVHELHMNGLRSKEGDLPLLHPAAYYTLNEIPK